MKRYFFGSALPGFAALLTLGGTVPAYAEVSLAQQQVQSIFSQLDDAYRRKDSKALKALMERNFTVDFLQKKKNKGYQTRQQLIDSATRSLDMLGKVDSSTTRIANLTVKGTTAVAVTQGKMVAHLTDSHGATVKLASANTTRYTLIKIGSDWKIRLMEDLTQDLKVDDHPVQPSSTSH